VAAQDLQILVLIVDRALVDAPLIGKHVVYIFMQGVCSNAQALGVAVGFTGDARRMGHEDALGVPLHPF